LRLSELRATISAVRQGRYGAAARGDNQTGLPNGLIVRQENMAFNVLIIKKPRRWELVSSSIRALSRNDATEIRYITDIEDLSDDPSVVDVLLMSVTGEADYVMEIHGKSVLALLDDTVATHVAISTGQSVIVGRDTPNRCEWQLLGPDGRVEDIDLDIEKLDEHSEVQYRIAEPAAARGLERVLQALHLFIRQQVFHQSRDV
jgi:hypothetical protein